MRRCRKLRPGPISSLVTKSKLQSPSSPRSAPKPGRSEEHTSELQSQSNLVCRLLLEKKKTTPLVVRGPNPCFEEQPAGHRRGPTRLLDALRAELAVAVRFGRGGAEED